eukprot:1176691-Prorocentrum_minimum.AAC.4
MTGRPTLWVDAPRGAAASHGAGAHVPLLRCAYAHHHCRPASSLWISPVCQARARTTLWYCKFTPEALFVGAEARGHLRTYHTYTHPPPNWGTPTPLGAVPLVVRGGDEEMRMRRRPIAH